MSEKTNRAQQEFVDAKSKKPRQGAEKDKPAQSAALPLTAPWKSKSEKKTMTRQQNTAAIPPEQFDLLQEYTPHQEEVGGQTRRYDKATGIAKGLLTRIEKAHPGNPLRQIDEFFAKFAVPAATGVKRNASLDTQRYYVKRLKSSVRELASINIKIQNLSELSRKHMVRLTHKWEDDGRSSSTMANKNTVLKRFGTWIGKPELCPSLPELLNDPERAKRTYSALTSKALPANNIDPQTIFEEMDKICLVTGLQLRLQLHFGLRVLETVMFKPFASDRGKELFVMDGTKGGKARLIPVETEEQRRLLEEAKVMASTHPKGILTDRTNRKLKQAVAHYYYLCRKVGLTKTDLGVTSHGLRHTFANNFYKNITGVDSPVNGGQRLPTAQDHAAQRQVSEVLGHVRRSITSAYLGNHVTLDRHRRTNLKALSSRLESNSELRQIVLGGEIESLWVLGPEADGNNTSAVLMVTSLRTDKTETAPDTIARITDTVGRLMNKPCVHISHANWTAQGLDSYELIGLSPQRLWKELQGEAV